MSALPWLLVRNAPAIAARSTFPALLILMVVAFLVIQDRIDRKDPKLALAPVYGEPDLPFTAPSALGDGLPRAALPPESPPAGQA